MTTIRRIRSGEADLFRQIRLASLQDAPYAFSSIYESASRRSAESWHEQAESTAQGSDRATFIAFSEDVPVGIAALYRVEGLADTGEVLQVWVGTEHRGTGLAWDLMDAVCKWASENNFRRLIAGVTDGNARAQKFYMKYGFRVTDEPFLNDSDAISLVKEVKQGRQHK